MLGDRFNWFLDVTIVYPEGPPSFWQFLCGSVPRIVVRARRLAIPREFSTGDYARDPAFRRTIQRWLQDMWRDKDRQIDALLGSGERSRSDRSAR